MNISSKFVSLASTPAMAPSLPTAAEATDSSSPAGDTYDPHDASTWSALQKHAAFFDGNHDGIITVRETFQGLRAIGIGSVQAAASATLINAALGVKSGSPWHHALDIRIAGVAAGKHGSDTGTYGSDGRLDPSKLDAIFSKHDHDSDSCLDPSELAEMIAANRTDSAGSRASKVEFSLLTRLAGTDRTRADGSTERVLTRHALEELYDGSLFYKLAEQHPKP